MRRQPEYDYIEPVFKTLRVAGYHRCDHPRVDDESLNCLDCGARRFSAGWAGGYLEYPRQPIRYELPPRSA